jgi:type I restriction enzyme S subunit
VRVSNWREVRLGDLVTFQRGHDLPRKEMKDGPYPVVGSNGIIGYHSEYTTDAPCITIGRSGNVGNPFLLKCKTWAHNTTLYVKEFKNTDPIFIYYLLKTLDLGHYAGGSAVPTLNRNHIHPILVSAPESIKEQHSIAVTLSVLDDMIELNNQINKTLEEMAQAIFKSWFVDFEPFKDEEFEESELGLIPKGWRVGKLSDVGEIIGGGTPSKSKPEYYSKKGIPWITPKDLSINKNKYISRGEIDISELGLRESSARLMPKGTVLFSSRAPIGYIAIAKNAVTTNQGFKSVVPFENISSEYIYLLLKNSINEIESRATGSTFKEISGGEMKKVPIILPPKEIIRKFNEIATTLGKIQASLEDENNILMSIRDTLLPKLMSGEIRVPVEEVI